jgi:hypothetical protein
VQVLCYNFGVYCGACGLCAINLVYKRLAMELALGLVVDNFGVWCSLATHPRSKAQVLWHTVVGVLFCKQLPCPTPRVHERRRVYNVPITALKHRRPPQCPDNLMPCSLRPAVCNIAPRPEQFIRSLRSCLSCWRRASELNVTRENPTS